MTRPVSYPRVRVELRKGEEFVNEWFKKSCCLVQVDDTYQGAIAGFLQFREQFRGRVGQEPFGFIISMFCYLQLPPSCVHLLPFFARGSRFHGVFFSSVHIIILLGARRIRTLLPSHRCLPDLEAT